MHLVTASAQSPVSPPAMWERDPRGNHFDFMVTIDMVYYIYMMIVRVEMGNRHGKGRHKVQILTAEQVEELRSFLAQNITVQSVLEKSWLADAVEAGLAKARLSRSAKAESDGR
jgi:hypothetical protein